MAYKNTLRDLLDRERQEGGGGKGERGGETYTYTERKKRRVDEKARRTASRERAAVQRYNESETDTKEMGEREERGTHREGETSEPPTPA